MENNKPAIEKNRALADNKKADNSNQRAAMEKRRALIEKRKKEMKRRKIITALIAVIMAFAGIAVGFALGRGSVSDDVSISSGNEEGRLSIETTTQNGDWITVKTSFINFRYPFAFSDIIEVETYNEGLSSQLRFYANIDGKKLLNYVIYFNSNEGISCGTLKLQGEIPVSVEFEKAPKKLSEDWLNTFYAVQETFNDVLKSMEENKAFISIE